MGNGMESRLPECQGIAIRAAAREWLWRKVPSEGGPPEFTGSLICEE